MQFIDNKDGNSTCLFILGLATLVTLSAPYLSKLHLFF